MERIIIDVATGQAVVETVSDDEAAELATLAADATTRMKAVDAAATTVRQAHPGGTIVQKLRDGTALTAGELQTVIRWLALRVVREIGGGA